MYCTSASPSHTETDRTGRRSLTKAAKKRPRKKEDKRDHALRSLLRHSWINTMVRSTRRSTISTTSSHTAYTNVTNIVSTRTVDAMGSFSFENSLWALQVGSTTSLAPPPLNIHRSRQLLWDTPLATTRIFLKLVNIVLKLGSTKPALVNNVVLLVFYSGYLQIFVSSHSNYLGRFLGDSCHCTWLLRIGRAHV